MYGLVKVFAAAMAAHLLLQASPLLAKPDDDAITFRGGGLDGLTTNRFVKKDGRRSLGFLPSPKGASPLPATLAPVVTGLVRAYEAGRPQDYSAFVEIDAESYSECPFNCDRHRKFLAVGFPFTERCIANDPYYSGYDERFGHIVRIEWLCGDDQELWYLSYLHIRNGKVWQLNTARATVPPVYSPAR